MGMKVDDHSFAVLIYYNPIVPKKSAIVRHFTHFINNIRDTLLHAPTRYGMIISDQHKR